MRPGMVAVLALAAGGCGNLLDNASNNGDGKDHTAVDGYAIAAAKVKDKWKADAKLFALGGTQIHAGKAPVSDASSKWFYDFVSPSSDRVYVVELGKGSGKVNYGEALFHSGYPNPF